MIKKLLTAVLMTIFFFSCQHKTEVADSKINFQKYNNIIESEFDNKVNKLKNRYSSFKIKKGDIFFHFTGPSEGFFKINFSSSRELNNKENFITRRESSAAKDIVLGTDFRSRSKAVYGRFVKQGDIKIKLYIKNFNDEKYPVFQVKEFNISIPNNQPTNPFIVKEWLKQMENINGYFSGTSQPFRNYMRMALPYKYTGRPGKYGYNISRRRRSNDPDVLDILSGKTAIKETFQSGYRKHFLINEPKNINIKEIRGITVKEIPFERMLKKRPVIFKSAFFVPYDNLYINLRTFSTALKFMDFIKEKNIFPGPFENDFRNFHIFEKVVKQMGLEPDTLEKIFGDSLIKNIAVSAEDFFFKNGTGISIIYETNNPDLFLSKLKQRNSKIREENDAALRISEYNNIKIGSIESKDHSVSLHYANLKNFFIVSNSIGSLKRSIDCHKGNIKSMDENFDFMYMRNIYKISDKDNDAFVFMADPFIRKTLSPEWIIGKMRRIAAEEDLTMISSAILFSRKEGNKGIADIKTLMRDRYLVKEALLNTPEDYYIDPLTSIPHSKTYGRIGFMKPVSELNIDMINKSELKVYREFKRFYSKFWDKFFDPIGISLKIDEKVEMKTTILPLISNSIYKAVSEIIGGNPVDLNPEYTKDTIVSLGLKLNNSQFIKELENSLNRYDYYNRKKSKHGIIGNNVTINFHDHDLRFFIDHKKLLKNTRLFTRSKRDLYISLIGSLFNLPVSFSIDLKNSDRFSSENVLEKIIFSLNRNSVFRRNNIEIYEIIPYKGQKIYSASIGISYIKLPFYVTVIKDKLVAATKLSIIEDMLQNRFKRDSGEEKGKKIRANAFVHLNSKGFKHILPQLKSFFLEKSLDISKSARLHYGAFLYPGRDNKLSFAEESVKFYGYSLNSALGEKFYYDPLYPYEIRSDKTGFNSIPSRLDNEGIKIFNESTLKNSTVNFSFTKFGIETKVIFDK